MDNEVSEDLKQYIDESDIQFQLVPPHVHWRNAAEWAVRTFKNNFMSYICTVDPHFPLYLWYQLLPQVIMTLNMLRRSYEQVDGVHNF